MAGYNATGDIEAIVSHRHDLGGDHWTTPDHRLIKGAPFSTLECVDYLVELGADPALPLLAESVELILDAWRDDGRFRLQPRGATLPCHTAWAARVLCRAGRASDERVQATLRHLAESRHEDGGWRCRKFSFGRGPETEFSNPHPTLQALDAFRLAGMGRAASDGGATHPDGVRLDGAVELLLSHWDSRAPLGPCHYGIGTLFLQPEFPFRGYNLFFWVYVLSFYEQARRDRRFQAALEALQRTTVDGQIVVQRVVPRLATLEFCRKGAPSVRATARYSEILANVGVVP